MTSTTVLDQQKHLVWQEDRFRVGEGKRQQSTRDLFI